MQVAATRASQTLPDFTPQAIANIMWAFAILAHNPGEQLLESVSADVYKRLEDFSPQHIAVTLWAFGKLEASPGAVLLQVHSLLSLCMHSRTALLTAVSVCFKPCCIAKQQLPAPESCQILPKASCLHVSF